MEELKPCPFCSGEAYLSDDGIEETHYKAVICKHCQSGTAYGSTEELAIASWNRRPSSPQGVEEAVARADREIVEAAKLIRQRDLIPNEHFRPGHEAEGQECPYMKLVAALARRAALDGGKP